MSQIKPYQISVPDSSLIQLKAKLSASTFPIESDFSDSWEYGTPLSDIKRLAKYWKDGFDWRAQEKLLNEKLPQFTTTVEVDGFDPLEIHFVHQKGKGKKNIPFLFCHGWPGSFLEVLKILPLLTEGNKDGVSFDVVAPSLPNYGFSQGVRKKGFGIPQYAEAIHKVMMNLGYDKYVTQGGDWGFPITRLVGTLYPEHCVASHINFFEVTRDILKTYIDKPDSLTQQEKDGLAQTQWFYEEGFGYNLEHCTKPSTIGCALADSPIAVLSWIYDKLHDWTDSYPWTDDEILTWISIYQFSRAGPAAGCVIYYESMHSHKELTQKRFEFNGKVKLGISYFPKDICVGPSELGRKLGDVVFERRHEDGGHFAAYERPELLVGDLIEMFGPKGGAKDVALKIAV